MNIERLEYFADVMQNFDRCDMGSYQSGGTTVNNIESFHACGKTACFAGRVAIDPKFQSEGGVCKHGIPVLNAFYFGHNAIAVYFDIRPSLAEGLVYGDLNIIEDDERNEFENEEIETYSCFYNKPWNEVKGKDVANKLRQIIAGEIK